MNTYRSWFLDGSKAQARTPAGGPERIMASPTMRKSPLNSLQSSLEQPKCLPQQPESSLRPQILCLAASQALPAAEKQGPAAEILSLDLKTSVQQPPGPCQQQKFIVQQPKSVLQASNSLPAAGKQCPAARILSLDLKSSVQQPRRPC